MEFHPVNHPLMFQEPRFMSTVSAWVEHFPFAFLLIELCRPRVLVELGSHMGDSYCAFCQAVSQLQTGTRCFAVDTWEGDPQAGRYGDDVLAELRAHHDPLYGGFSKLMQMTFDDAAGHFEAGQIDLLHIDGLHTYEAVRHDYETWRQKMSDRGIILFHDTAMRNRTGFGVWKLWEELSSQFASFEFTHCCGLGVLLVGANVPKPMQEFLAFANANPGGTRLLFHSLGQRMAFFQDVLRTSRSMLSAYKAIDQWRARTGQEHLRPADVQIAIKNLPSISAFVAHELMRVLAAAAPPTPPQR